MQLQEDAFVRGNMNGMKSIALTECAGRSLILYDARTHVWTTGKETRFLKYLAEDWTAFGTRCKAIEARITVCSERVETLVKSVDELYNIFSAHTRSISTCVFYRLFPAYTNIGAQGQQAAVLRTSGWRRWQRRMDRFPPCRVCRYLRINVTSR